MAKARPPAIQKSRATIGIPEDARPPARGLGVLAGAALVAITVAAYLPALSAGFIWDDDFYVINNHTLETADGLRRIWCELGATDQYYPMVFTTFWLEHHLWGLAPAGYHLVNILLHATSAVLVWIILSRWLPPRGTGARISESSRRLIDELLSPAWLAAAIFALHPVHVESVAWITERKNVLSGFFYFLALLAYQRYAPINEAGSAHTLPLPRGGLGWGLDRCFFWYLAAFALFLFALLSKSVTASLPAAILLLIWWRRGRLSLRDVVPLIPFFTAGIAMGSITAHMERTHVGTEGIDWGLTFPDRCLIAGRAVWFYLGKLLWPSPLIFSYPRCTIDRGDAVQWIAPVAVVLAFVLLWALRRQIGRGPLVAALFFVGTLFPALGFVDVYPFLFSFVADHFQYLASLGLIVLAAALLTRLSVQRRATAAISAALLLVLAALTARQTLIYRDLETLWRDTIAKNPESWMAEGNLGAELQRQGRFLEAIEHYKKGLVLRPEAPQVHFDLGSLLFQMGRSQEAAGHLTEALRLHRDFPSAHNIFGLALASLGRREEAATHYRATLALLPDDPDAHNNLANLLYQDGKLDAAIDHYRRALAGKPINSTARFNLAVTLERQGKADVAMAELNTLIRNDANFAQAHVERASLLAGAGRLDEAAASLTEAIRLRPDREARLQLASVREIQGKWAAAADQYRQWLQAHPGDAEVGQRLNNALARQQAGGRQ